MSNVFPTIQPTRPSTGATTLAVPSRAFSATAFTPVGLLLVGSGGEIADEAGSFLVVEQLANPSERQEAMARAVVLRSECFFMLFL